MSTQPQNTHERVNMASQLANGSSQSEADFALYLSQRLARTVSSEEAARFLCDWSRYFAALARIDERTGGTVGVIPTPALRPPRRTGDLRAKPADATVDPVSLPSEQPNNSP